MSKHEIQKILDALPDDVSVEDVMYRLYVLDKHDNAMKDIQNGEIFTPDDVRAFLNTNG